MKILAIDTSSRNCSVAIVEASKDSFSTISLKNSNDERTHSVKLMPMVDEMFKKSNLCLNDIDLLACCLGPGSFTGIRIGVASCKAFADAKSIPVVGVTSLESLAYNVENNGYIVSMIDAKNNNVYATLAINNDSKYELKKEFSADSIENILNDYLAFFNDNNITHVCFVGNGSEIYKDLISEKFANFNVTFSDNNTQSGITLSKCAYKKYLEGAYGDANSISPIYLRKSQAERAANGEK